MTEPRWLSPVYLLSIHTDQIQAHGGSLGIRDKGLLLSALERPKNRFQYEPEVDLAGLGAAYGFGISSNHPFVDGNKRIAFLAMYSFLGLNGLDLEATEADVVAIILALASGELQESSLADWIRAHMIPR